MIRKITLLVFVGFVFLQTAERAHSQRAIIIAFVNEELITLHDLQQQIKLFQLFGALPKGQVINENTQAQILENLINQKLRLQLAREAQSLATQSELDAGRDRLANNLKIPPENFARHLGQQGLDTEVVDNFLASQIAWEQYIRRFIFQTRPAASEIDLIYRRELNQLSQTQYWLDEIVLRVNSILDDNQKRNQATDLITQLNAGASFESLAQNISQSATANSGGDLGWQAEGELLQEAYNAISLLGKGQITQSPIRTAEGYAIYRLRETRSPNVDYQQFLDYDLYLFGLQGRAQSYASEFAEDKTVGCSNVKPRQSSYELKKISNQKAHLLDGDIQNQTAILDDGQKSDLFFYQNQWAVLVLCKRREEGFPPISRDDIFSKVAFDRLNQFVLQYFEQKRREAFIDIKL